MIIGSIILFALPAAQIPAGWQVADGTNGTLDLTSGFVRGASGDGDVGATGGQDNQTHIFTAGSHSHLPQSGPPNQFDSGAPNKFSAAAVSSGTTDSAENRPVFNTAYYIQRIA